LSIRYIELLSRGGDGVIGRQRRDSYDNALAETVIGLYKTEVIKHLGPWDSHNKAFGTRGGSLSQFSP